ncbi:hypothetical protein ACFL6P_05415 [Candidatus Latescibacterota bacterium]
MNTHGHITLAPYLHGFDKSEQLYPGYRSEFMTYVDFFSVGSFVMNSLLGTTTIISDQEQHGMRLDRIRYTLTPGFRYEFTSWLIKGALHHECIHTISRPEFNGSTWWNSFQIGAGTKGSYLMYLREEYKNVRNSFLNSWDAQVKLGTILPSKGTVFSGQNHDYKYEIFSHIRYHLGSFRRWAYFAGLKQNAWVKEDNTAEHQIALTLNVFKRDTVHFAGVYYTYNIYDTFMLDNADGMGSLGFKIIF